MNYIKLHYELMHQKGYTLTEKIVWAYIQGFPKCFASDKNITKALGITCGTVRQTLHKIRLKSGIKGRNWPKSATIPCYQAVTACYHTVTPMLPHGNTQEAKTPMKTGVLLDNYKISILDTKSKPEISPLKGSIPDEPFNLATYKWENGTKHTPAELEEAKRMVALARAECAAIVA
jgi:hypothetical protein